MQTVALTISGMSCGHCVAAVREALAEVPGVEVRDVRLGRAELVLDDADASAALAAARAAVEEAGYATAEGDAAPAAPLTPLTRARGA